MKKMLIFLTIIVALFIIIGIMTNIQKDDKLSDGNPYGKDDLKSSTVDQLDDPNYQNLILPDELDKKLADKSDITVYYYSPECQHCVRTTPVVAPLAEEMGIDLVQYNILEFEQGWNDYGIVETPTIIHYENGEEQARISGYQEKEVFKNWFEKNDIN